MSSNLYTVILFINASRNVSKQNTWGVKKVRDQEEPVTKSSDIK